MSECVIANEIKIWIPRDPCEGGVRTYTRWVVRRRSTERWNVQIQIPQRSLRFDEPCVPRPGERVIDSTQPWSALLILPVTRPQRSGTQDLAPFARVEKQWLGYVQCNATISASLEQPCAYLSESVVVPLFLVYHIHRIHRLCHGRFSRVADLTAGLTDVILPLHCLEPPLPSTLLIRGRLRRMALFTP